uniref:wall-associated receptor kinase 2-like n=1 Tax=Erigeron canadensis TaxID=72917 RepID=UPI001CB99DEB|nr:wall-associated receptor kinase 2-like [Erigeron canadensis]
MKILILTVLGILVMLSFTASETKTNPIISIPETYNLINGTGNFPIAKPGCNTTCGDLIVPYPFGIGHNSNCSIDKGFDIYCNTSYDPPKAFFTETGKNVWIKLISDSTLRTSNLVASRCYYPDGTTSSNSSGNSISYNFNNWPYTFSKVNKFTVIGCNDYAWLTSRTKSNEASVSTGCMVFCPNATSVNISSDECSGNGCCRSSIPQDISYYFTQVNNLSGVNQTDSERCTHAFVGEENTFKYNGSASYLSDPSYPKNISDNVPVVLDWAIGSVGCAEANATDGYACQSNSTCVDSVRKSGGYRCQCNEGFQGNPYLSPGCQDIDECEELEKHSCYGVCKNTPGNYTCSCKKGYFGDPKVPNGCKHKPFVQTLLFKLGIGLALPAIVIGLLLLFFMSRKRKLVKLRERYYDQNGGALLKEKLKTKGGIGVGSVNIFRIEELEDATDNFSESRVLGRGGNGTVYKGTLSDKRLVAIKKSQRVDQGQREEFINEMVILTQINHTNVVQLIGFCLEADIPLLAYEYVPNDTLHRHIHNRTNGTRRLSWDDRLRIAHESAGALAYLHTDARMSIIHRDVKSTNILLDENYTAKIADFGASRLVPLGHDEVVTLVQGTFGYLDPEYFHSGELTDKSDVYSFGVVLAELLTGQQPLSIERCLKERNLATYFVKAVKENTLLDIVERGVVKEASDEQLQATSGLVCRCLNQVGVNRPNMKEVTMELDRLRKLGTHTNWVSEDNYNETSSLMIEMEPTDFYTIPLMPKSSDTFGDSSITSEMQDMMLQLKSAR